MLKKVNLGCGKKPLDGYVNVDFYEKSHADVVADITKGLPFENSEIDEVFADQVFEHISNSLDLMSECYRVLKPKGKLIVRVPYFKSKFAFVDPTHVNFYTLTSMDYFVKGTYNNYYYAFHHFSFEDLELVINDGRGVWKKKFTWLVYRYSDVIENSVIFNLFFKIRNVTFILTK